VFVGNHEDLAKDERGAFEREAWEQRWTEGEPKRPEDPREQRPRPELILQVRRGVRLRSWDKAVGAPATSSRGLLGKCQSGRGIGNNSLDHGGGGKLRREKPRSVGS